MIVRASDGCRCPEPCCAACGRVRPPLEVQAIATSDATHAHLCRHCAFQIVPSKRTPSGWALIAVRGYIAVQAGEAMLDDGGHYPA